MKPGKLLDEGMEKVGCNKEGNMAISEERLEATIVLKNIKGHTYSVSNYELSENEANIVINALNKYLADLKYEEELKVIGSLGE